MKVTCEVYFPSPCGNLTGNQITAENKHWFAMLGSWIAHHNFKSVMWMPALNCLSVKL